MIRVLSLGTKFISKWEKTNLIEKFSISMNLNQTNKVFHIKNKSIPLVEYTAVNNFCWNVRDEINVLFEKDLVEKQNMSNKAKKALNALIKNRNEVICVNGTDKNLGARSADKEDVILECRRQLYDIITYNKTSWEEVKSLIDKIKFDLKNIVRKHMEKGSCSYQEANFLLSKTESFSIPHFYIIGKILKI